MPSFKTTGAIVNLQNPTIKNKIVHVHLISKTREKDKTTPNVKMGYCFTLQRALRETDFPPFCSSYMYTSLS